MITHAINATRPRFWRNALVVPAVSCRSIRLFHCRLWFGNGGSSQWRLDGPGAWEGADAQVRKVPGTDLMKWGLLALLGLLFVFLCWIGIFFIILDDIFDWDLID